MVALYRNKNNRNDARLIALLIRSCCVKAVRVKFRRSQELRTVLRVQRSSVRPDLVTNVAVHKIKVHERHQLAGAWHDLAGRALTPKVLSADSHYGSADSMTIPKNAALILQRRHGRQKLAVRGAWPWRTSASMRSVRCRNSQAVSHRSRPLRQTRNFGRVLILPHAGNAPTGTAE